MMHLWFLQRQLMVYRNHCNVLRKKGMTVLTWDSDVNPKDRSFYISQGTPDQLANLLIEMTSKQIGDKGKVAFFILAQQ